MSDEEDEFKVHATDDIEVGGGEAGEPSSGEEGEIKGEIWREREGGGKKGGSEGERRRSVCKMVCLHIAFQ